MSLREQVTRFLQQIGMPCTVTHLEAHIDKLRTLYARPVRTLIRKVADIAQVDPGVKHLPGDVTKLFLSYLHEESSSDVPLIVIGEDEGELPLSLAAVMYMPVIVKCRLVELSGKVEAFELYRRLTCPHCGKVRKFRYTVLDNYEEEVAVCDHADAKLVEEPVMVEARTCKLHVVSGAQYKDVDGVLIGLGLLMREVGGREVPVLALPTCRRGARSGKTSMVMVVLDVLDGEVRERFTLHDVDSLRLIQTVSSVIDVAHLFAPMVVGLLPQKMLLLLQAVGAWCRSLFDGSESSTGRFVIHGVHVGCPGQAKTVLSSQVAEIVPRSFKCVAGSFTSVGAFIAMQGGQWKIGPFVLTGSSRIDDWGIVIIDEFEKLFERGGRSRNMTCIDPRFMDMLMQVMEECSLSRAAGGSGIPITRLYVSFLFLSNWRYRVYRTNLTLAENLPEIFLTDPQFFNRIDYVALYPLYTSSEEVANIIRHVITYKSSKWYSAGLDSCELNRALRSLVLYARKIDVKIGMDVLDGLRSLVDEVISELKRLLDITDERVLTTLALRQTYGILRLCVAYSKLVAAVHFDAEAILTMSEVNTVMSMLKEMYAIFMQSIGEDSGGVVPTLLVDYAADVGRKIREAKMLLEGHIARIVNVRGLAEADPDMLAEEILNIAREDYSTARIVARIVGEQNLDSPLVKEKLKMLLRHVLEMLCEEGKVKRLDSGKYRLVEWVRESAA